MANYLFLSSFSTKFLVSPHDNNAEKKGAFEILWKAKESGLKKVEQRLKGKKMLLFVNHSTILRATCSGEQHIFQ